MSNSPLRRSGMAPVNEGSHRFTLVGRQKKHPASKDWVMTFIHKWNEPHLPLQPSRRASPHFGRYSFSVPLRVEGWVGLSGWSQTGVFYPAAEGVTHPSTNGARRRVTSLIETNVLPLSKAATSEVSKSIQSTDEQRRGVVEENVSDVRQAELSSVEHPAPRQPVDRLVEARSAAPCHRSVVPLTLITAAYRRRRVATSQQLHGLRRTRSCAHHSSLHIRRSFNQHCHMHSPQPRTCTSSSSRV